MKSSESKKFHWEQFISGWAAATTNVFLTFPVIKITWRQVLYNISATKAVHQIYDEGIFILYRGVMPPLLQKSVTLSMMFGVYNQAYSYFTSKNYSPLISNIGGGLTSASIQTLVMPMERIQTLMVSKDFLNVYRNTIHAFYDISLNYGIKELYRGLPIMILRNAANHSSFFVFKFYLDKPIRKIQIPIVKTAANFGEGALLGGISSVIFFPLTSLKIIVHNTVGTKYKNIISVSREVYKRGGIKSFYRGVTMNCVRSLMSGGIINASYEFYIHLIKKMI